MSMRDWQEQWMEAAAEALQTQVRLLRSSGHVVELVKGPYLTGHGTYTRALIEIDGVRWGLLYNGSWRKGDNQTAKAERTRQARARREARM